MRISLEPNEALHCSVNKDNSDCMEKHGRLHKHKRILLYTTRHETTIKLSEFQAVTGVGRSKRSMEKLPLCLSSSGMGAGGQEATGLVGNMEIWS